MCCHFPLNFLNAYIPLFGSETVLVYCDVIRKRTKEKIQATRCEINILCILESCFKIKLTGMFPRYWGCSQHRWRFTYKRLRHYVGFHILPQIKENHTQVVSLIPAYLILCKSNCNSSFRFSYVHVCMVNPFYLPVYLQGRIY